MNLRQGLSAYLIIYSLKRLIRIQNYITSDHMLTTVIHIFQYLISSAFLSDGYVLMRHNSFAHNRITIFHFSTDLVFPSLSRSRNSRAIHTDGRHKQPPEYFTQGTTRKQDKPDRQHWRKKWQFGVKTRELPEKMRPKDTTFI